MIGGQKWVGRIWSWEKQGGGTALREKAGGKEEKGAEPFSHLNVSECGSAPRALHSTEDSTFS